MRTPRIVWCVAVCVLALQSAAAELKFSISRYSTLPLLSVPLSLSYRSGDEWVRLAPTIEVQLLALDGGEPVATWRGLVDLGGEAEGDARLETSRVTSSPFVLAR